MDQLGPRVDDEFDVIDEAEHGCSKLGVNVIVARFDNGDAFHPSQRRFQFAQGRGGARFKSEGRDVVGRDGGFLAANAIGRIGAGGEFAAGRAEIGRPE